MKRIYFPSIWGIVLITAGLLFLIQGRPYIRTGSEEDNRWAVVWAALFAVSAVTFLGAYLADRVRWWWTVIPGTILAGLALIITFGVVGGVAGEWIAALWLAAISLGFWIVYLDNRERWWAVIPGGVLITVALIPLLAAQFQGEAIAAILFLGMALTFGLVYVLPTPRGRMTWALIPAGVLAVLGVVFLLGFTATINYIVAAVMILVGLYLLAQQLRGGQRVRRQ